MSYEDATEAAGILIKSWDQVTKIIEEHRRDISIESRELSVRAPENLGELSFALRIKSGFYGGKMTFDVPQIGRLVVHSLPAFKREDQTVKREGEKLIFDASKLQKNTDVVLLSLEYGMDPFFLDNLISRKWQLDPESWEDSDRYWIAAQLKHLKTLQDVYDKLELRGVDLRVDVGVYQDIKTKIPQRAMRTIERGSEFISTRDREKLLRLMLEQRRDVGYMAGTLMQAIRQLTDLFLPSRFERFVDVIEQFRYYGCQQGPELIAPMLALPKFMTVISRTDLSLEEPAKKGYVVYYKKRIQDAIGRIFS